MFRTLLIVFCFFGNPPGELGAHTSPCLFANTYFFNLPILWPTPLDRTQPVFKGNAHTPSVVKSIFLCLVRHACPKEWTHVQPNIPYDGGLGQVTPLRCAAATQPFGLLISKHAFCAGPHGQKLKHRHHPTFFLHPPVQCMAPSGERSHGYAKVQNDLPCQSVRGMLIMHCAKRTKCSIMSSVQHTDPAILVVHIIHAGCSKSSFEALSKGIAPSTSPPHYRTHNGHKQGSVVVDSEKRSVWPRFLVIERYTSRGRTECAYSVGFQWSLSLLPDLCPLCVP